MKSSVKNESQLNEMIRQGFLKFLDEELITFWNNYGDPEVYPEQSILFYKGHYPIGIHILMKGSIHVKYLQDRKWKHVHVTAPVMIGLGNILNSSAYKYSVVTNEESELIFLPKNSLPEELVEQHLKM